MTNEMRLMPGLIHSLKTHTPDWVQINPGASFPLYVAGLSPDLVDRMQAELEAGKDEGSQRQAERILPMVALPGFRCREIDEYVTEYRPKYDSNLHELMNSAEWEKAKDDERDELLLEFQSDAVDSLDVRPYCALPGLFEDWSNELAALHRLFDRHSPEDVFFIYRKLRKIHFGTDGPVTGHNLHFVHPEHRDRARFESLVRGGLAQRVDAPSPAARLECLTLKELNAILGELGTKAAKRKADAITAVMSLPDAGQRVAALPSMVAFNLTVPAELSREGLQLFDVLIAHLREVAELIAQTYSASRFCMEEDEIENSSLFDGWETSCIGDNRSCPCCKKMAKQRLKNRPTMPRHIGCRCSAGPRLRVR